MSADVVADTRESLEAVRLTLPAPRVLVGCVGLPRAGKSSWVGISGWPVVSPDAIRRALTGQAFYAPAEPVVWGHARLMVRALFWAGHRTVVLDATNTSRARRREWYDDAWDTYWKTFDVCADVCRARAAADPETLYLVPVIDRMAARYEPLVATEKPWPGPGRPPALDPALDFANL